MVEHGYIVDRTCVSRIVWPNFWQPVHPDSMPNQNQLVWCYLPDIGNEDDGYGYVVPGRIEWLSRTWRDYAGHQIEPIFWAVMLEPEPPVAWPSKEETVAKAEQARKQVVERSGPFARQG